jgi:DNA-directed RNA polymerase subunit RPC12/RpoP
MEVCMSALRTIGYIFSAILIVFGVLFILAAFGGGVEPVGSLITGGILVAIGFGIILLAGIFKPKSQETVTQQTTLQVDLPGDVNVERFKCQDCGAQLSMDNVKMIAGAPMVDCPYCGAAYQLTEKPKW